jgi:IPT/TIG domain-containing protein
VSNSTTRYRQAGKGSPVDHRPPSQPDRTTALVAVLAALAVTSFSGCTGAGPAPAAPLDVTAVAPASGPAAGGTPITVDGAGFTAGARVRLGGADAAQVVVVSPTRITAVAPAHAGGPADVEVLDATGDTASLGAAFTFVDAPGLAYVDPGHLPQAGGAVVLHGQAFAPGAQVRFGADASVGPPERLSAGQLVAVAPPHAPGAVDVAVVNPDGQQAVLFSGLAYDADPPRPPAAGPPVLAGVAPEAGSEGGGTVLTLTGSDFDPQASVMLGGSPATVTGRSATSLTVSTPPHAPGLVDVAVQNPDGQTSTRAGAFTYVAVPPPPPVLASLTPASGPEAGGTTVVLGGSGFLAGATVTFGGAPATVLGHAPDALTVLIGSHPAAVVGVEVTNPDGQRSTLPAAFTYLAAPALALHAVAPASGPTAGGTGITLTGAFAAGATVTVGGVAASDVAVTDSSITATTPPHAAGVVAVAVRNPDGATASLAAAFTFVAPPPPAPTAAAPSSGPDLGGAAVTIAGSGFEAGATVTFGGAPALVANVGATAIAVTAPPHAAGAVDLVVTNPDGRQGTLAAGFTYLPPPRLAGLSPTSGPAAGGTTVALAGAGFQPGAVASFGGAPAAVVSASSSELVVRSPPHAAGPVEVVLVNPDGRLAALPGGFTYLAPPPAAPALSQVSPATGTTLGGEPVSLTGTGFEAGATVTFGGVPATVDAVTATAISVTTPVHPAGVVEVVVVNPGGQAATLAASFTFVAPEPLVLTSVLPASGSTAGGTAVALSGAGFRPGASVTFGGAAAAVVASAATAIAVTTPAHAAGAVDVTVTNPDGQATTLPAGFAYQAPAPPPPVLSGLSPVSGPTAGGTVVTLSGAAFSSAVTVSFGGAAATVTAAGATSITTTTPPHAAGGVDVVVTNADGQAATLAAAFGYLEPPPPPPPPVLAGVSPATGPIAGGTRVVLSGSGFAAGATVAFGAAAAAVESLTATSLTVTSPAGAAGAVAVQVTNPDGQSSTLPGGWTYLAPPPPPTLASATPASGGTAGGTSVLLAGTGFAFGATVTVGGAAATVGGLGATAISITTPAHAAGASDVVVTNPDGQQATLAGGFTFVAPPAPPVLQAVSPASGDVAGGTSVILAGTGFAGAAGVTFGGAAATVTGASATSLTVTTPAGVAGAVDVAVTNPDGQGSTLAAAFTYTSAPVGQPPAFDGLTPASGYDMGGTTVTITGSEFVNPVVAFGGVPVAPLAASKTSITVVTPPHAVGAVDVTVTNLDGQSATRAGAYTYVAVPVIPPPVITSVSPASGPTSGNTSVTITGTGFASGATVSFGGVDGLGPSVTATTITVTTPGGAAGPIDVKVTNFDRQQTTLAGGFTYVAPPPVVTAVNVRGSPQAGGGLLLFAGGGLGNTVSVTFGGVPATGLTFDPLRGTLTVTVPASPLGPTADGFVDLVLTNLDGQATTWPGFHYGNPPQALSFTPTTGQKGDTVVITGVDFTADASGPRSGLQVQFGGTPAVIIAKSATEISVTVPKLNPGSYPLVVVNFDSQFSVAPGTFFLPGP